MANHQQERQKKPETFRVSEWFAGPDAERVVRRADVWALLGWYHRTQVKPHLTVRGALRRLWWKISGQPERLLSPWEELAARIAFRKAQREFAEAIARQNGNAAEEPSSNDDSPSAAKPKIIT